MQRVQRGVCFASGPVFDTHIDTGVACFRALPFAPVGNELFWQAAIYQATRDLRARKPEANSGKELMLAFWYVFGNLAPRRKFGALLF